MTLTIRRGTADDARAAADLYLRARSAALGAIPPLVHDDDDVRGHFASHVVSACELWLAEEPPGALAGILVLDGDHVDQLTWIPSAPAAALAAACSTSPSASARTGFGSGRSEQHGAQRFYLRHGFVEAERTDGRGNEERAPDILYVYGGAPG